VGRAEIERTLAHFITMLRIRKNSPLFRLPTADDIVRRVRFPNVGYHQLVGLVVLHLDDRAAPALDPQWSQIVVLFNAAPYEQTFRDGALSNAGFALHPIQAASPFAAGTGYYGPEGAFWLPAYSTAVFVAPRPAAG
jgi:pullulanase